MDNSQFLTAISQVGFPIVLTAYLLLRFEKKLEILTESILKLMEVINNKSDDDHYGK